MNEIFMPLEFFDWACGTKLLTLLVPFEQVLEISTKSFNNLTIAKM